jgi:hypothetical protein
MPTISSTTGNTNGTIQPVTANDLDIFDPFTPRMIAAPVNSNNEFDNVDDPFSGFGQPSATFPANHTTTNTHSTTAPLFALPPPPPISQHSTATVFHPSLPTKQHTLPHYPSISDQDPFGSNSVDPFAPSSVSNTNTNGTFHQTEDDNPFATAASESYERSKDQDDIMKKFREMYHIRSDSNAESLISHERGSPAGHRHDESDDDLDKFDHKLHLRNKEKQMKQQQEELGEDPAGGNGKHR